MPDGFVQPLDAWRLWLLLDHLGVSRAALLGHSAGGPVIRAMYRLAPRRVWAMIDIDGGAFGQLTLARNLPNDRFSPAAAALYETNKAQMEQLRPHHRGDYPSLVTIQRRLIAYERAKMPPEARAAARKVEKVAKLPVAPPALAAIPDQGKFILCACLQIQTGRGKLRRRLRPGMGPKKLPGTRHPLRADRRSRPLAVAGRPRRLPGYPRTIPGWPRQRRWATSEKKRGTTKRHSSRLMDVPSICFRLTARRSRHRGWPVLEPAYALPDLELALSAKNEGFLRDPALRPVRGRAQPPIRRSTLPHLRCWPLAGSSSSRWPRTDHFPTSATASIGMRRFRIRRCCGCSTDLCSRCTENRWRETPASWVPAARNRLTDDPSVQQSDQVESRVRRPFSPEISSRVNCVRGSLSAKIRPTAEDPETRSRWRPRYQPTATSRPNHPHLLVTPGGGVR